MTLVIGARCADGIVIGTDRKVKRGPEPSFDNKIVEKSNVIFGIAGVTGIWHDLLDLLDSEMERARGFGSLYEAKIATEDIVSELYRRYRERIGERDAEIDVLMGGLKNKMSGEARLYHISGVGYGEAESRLCMIGSGYPPAASIAKFLISPDLSVEENAYRVAFIIGWIRGGVDDNVGGTPQVAMIRDGDPKVEYLSEERAEEAAKRGEQARDNLGKLVGFEKSPQE